MQPSVLIVGGGMTGAVISAIMKSNSLFPSNVKDIGPIHVWDKSRGIGGRMSTSRWDNNNQCIADLGAQYITMDNNCSSVIQEFYSDMLLKGILKPMECRVLGGRHSPLQKNFICPLGISSVVKHFIGMSGVTAMQEKCLVSLHQEDKSWKATCSDGYQGLFSKVILTMPVPQILALKGDIQASIDNFQSNLSKVSYSVRYALILYYNTAECGYDWGVQYLDNHPVFRYVSVENVKRGKLSDPASIVFHTTTEFGAKNVDRVDNAEIEEQLLQHARILLPQLPDPDGVRCHKWRYSQVTSTYPESQGCLVLHKDPLIMLAGDAFTKSTMSGCIESAIRSVQTINT